MSRPSPRRRGPSPVVAGSQLIATLLLCTAVFGGVGALFGATVPLGIAGLFVGFGAGLAVVVKRFSDV
jgi:F0F1-type ATP synthase assembly protein I